MANPDLVITFLNGDTLKVHRDADTQVMQICAELLCRCQLCDANRDFRVKVFEVWTEDSIGKNRVIIRLENIATHTNTSPPELDAA